MDVKAPLPARELLFKQAMDLFECTQCGTCCRGEGGIHLTPEEIDRISDFLNFSPRDFLKKFCLEKNEPGLYSYPGRWLLSFFQGRKMQHSYGQAQPLPEMAFLEPHADRPAQLGNGP